MAPKHTGGRISNNDLQRQIDDNHQALKEDIQEMKDMLKPLVPLVATHETRMGAAEESIKSTNNNLVAVALVALGSVLTGLSSFFQR
jgi:hypothetical protein